MHKHAKSNNETLLSLTIKPVWLVFQLSSTKSENKKWSLIMRNGLSKKCTKSAAYIYIYSQYHYVISPYHIVDSLLKLKWDHTATDIPKHNACSMHSGEVIAKTLMLIAVGTGLITTTATGSLFLHLLMVELC